MDENDIVYSIRLGGAYKVPRKLLTIFGLWLTRPKYYSLSILSVSLIYILIIIIFIFELISRNLFTLYLLAFHLVYYLRVTTWFLKTWTLLSKRKNIISLLLDCFTNIQAPRFLMNNVKRFQNNCYNGINKKIVSLIIIIACVPQFIRETYKNPNVIWYISYLKMFLFMTLVLESIGFNVFYITTIRLIVKLLNHINDVVLTLHSNDNFGIEKLDSRKQLQVTQTLIYVTKMHQRVIKLTDGINKTFSFVMFFDLWSVHILFYATMLEFAPQVLTGSTIYYMVAMLSVVFGLYSYHFTISWIASDIINKSSDKLRWNLWHAAWWTWDKNNMRISSIIAARAKKEIRLNAGPFYTLSIQTFATMLGVALSYAIIIYQLQDYVQTSTQ